MFRSLAVGLAHIRRETLTAADEERNADQVRSIHWFPYDRVGVVNADP
jgi:hypothetical protein